MKEPEPPSSWATVDEPRAARAMADPALRRVLEPFMGRERTVGAAAVELGLGKNAALLKVRRLLGLGLLRVTREEPRKGRAIKHYTASADGFFVPYALTGFESPEGWLVADLADRERALASATMRAGLGWGEARGTPLFGKRLFRREDGAVEADFAFSFAEDASAALLAPEAPAVALFFGSTDLDFASAKRLQRELLELATRYERRGGGRRYLLRLGLAPAED